MPQRHEGGLTLSANSRNRAAWFVAFLFAFFDGVPPLELRAHFDCFQDNSMPDRRDNRPSTSSGISEFPHGQNSNFDLEKYPCGDVGFSRRISSPDDGSP